jgi:hypothetical protein
MDFTRPVADMELIYWRLQSSLEMIEATVAKRPYAARGASGAETVARRDQLDVCPETPRPYGSLIGAVVDLSLKERFHE